MGWIRKRDSHQQIFARDARRAGSPGRDGCARQPSMDRRVIGRVIRLIARAGSDRDGAKAPWWRFEWEVPGCLVCCVMEQPGGAQGAAGGAAVARDFLGCAVGSSEAPFMDSLCRPMRAVSLSRHAACRALRPVLALVRCASRSGRACADILPFRKQRVGTSYAKPQKKTPALASRRFQ